MAHITLFIPDSGIAPNVILGRRLLIARTASGHTQSTLAQAMNVTQKTICTWEKTGNIPSYLLGKLATETQQERDFFIL